MAGVRHRSPTSESNTCGERRCGTPHPVTPHPVTPDSVASHPDPSIFRRFRFQNAAGNLRSEPQLPHPVQAVRDPANEEPSKVIRRSWSAATDRDRQLDRWQQQSSSAGSGPYRGTGRWITITRFENSSSDRVAFRLPIFCCGMPCQSHPKF